jgi:PAS domain S-box-containing protein
VAVREGDKTVASQPKEPTFQQLVEAVGDFAIYMLDTDGRVISWSPAAELTHGWRREDIEGQSFARLFTIEDQCADLPERMLARVRGEGRVKNAGWRLRKDGRRFWAIASLHAIRDDEGEISGFAAVTRDTTSKRAARLDLIESERRFRYLVEGVVDYAIYMLDVAGVVTTGTAEPSAPRVTGPTRWWAGISVSSIPRRTAAPASRSGR